MFSRRSRFAGEPTLLAAALEQRQAAGRPVYDLTCSNPTTAGLAIPELLIREALAHAENAVYRPDPRGLPAVRETVCATYRRRGARISPEDVIAVSCTSEAYAWLFKLLCDPGDRILVPAPSYPLLRYLAQLEGLELAHYPLYFAGEWLVDLDSLEEQLQDPRVRAVVLVHPNNPTGSYVKPGEWERLCGAAAARGAAVLCDAVFFDYILGDLPPLDPWQADAPGLLFILDGLSKAYLAPQLKLAWITVRGPSELRRRALSTLEIISDSYLTLSTPAQWALPRLAPERDRLQAAAHARLAANLRSLGEALERTAASLLRPEGGWYACIRLPAGTADEDWCVKLLRETGVLVHPGGYFDFPDADHVVVSLLTPPETFATGIRELAARLLFRGDTRTKRDRGESQV
ncbi:MAG: pyridoxal phosphate-dependent aminotransferase [Acidobacteriota bacterium]